YKGNALDAVAQLYEHHGLDRPSGTVEKASKAAARRDVRGRGQRNREGDFDGDDTSSRASFGGGKGAGSGGGGGGG
ncbi:unnamed protein product, partial [Polarella glacialis]